MKKTIAMSVALISILAIASGPALAESITHLIPRAKLANICAGKINTSFPVTVRRSNGELLTGTVECTARNARSWDNYDHDDDNDDDDYDDDDDDDDNDDD